MALEDFFQELKDTIMTKKGCGLDLQISNH